MTALDAGLVAAVVAAAAVTIFLRDLVRAALGLALTSALLALLIYRLGAPWAAVFELSVVAGLITVLFVVAITLTRGGTEAAEPRWPLRLFPVAIVAAGLLALAVLRLAVGDLPADPAAPAALRFGNALWGVRLLDLLGQAAVILGGVVGVLALLREPKPGEKH